MQSLFKNEAFQIFVIAIMTAFAGEFKINPWSGDIFRLGLGASTLLLSLLLMQHLPFVKTGAVTGIVVVLFRMTEDAIGFPSSFSVASSFQSHLAGGVFYLVFTSGMRFIQRRLAAFQPLILGAVVSAIDLLANETELVTRRILEGMSPFLNNGLALLGAIAVLRSYFIIGLFSSISIRQMRLIQAEQQKRIEQMLNIGSGLYGESFYLRKSMDTIERITASSFELYSKLKQASMTEYSRQALGIAQQIHEVKKDSQRILAGLTKLYDREIAQEMKLEEIFRYVIKANQTYSEMLKKELTIEGDLKVDFSTSHYIVLLTVLNNLVANAVEAMNRYGLIRIRAFDRGDRTVFEVVDSGKGIPERDRQIIFEPGFTTKFDQDGVAATGIGLSHVRDIVGALGGEIRVSTPENGKGARFIVALPTITLRKGA
ncbi:sensor histidine kinase [Cohnella thermotolerans]|uniref:sensor histidine kinase n=1 Tax=Cohnella thermotolerans TaxID=329858 RepID=UPI00047B31D1|nr:sensor histidine kinase [Cohnella thermotolerans]